jgi:glycosyltransferase involved in cell wall biosynthesis
MADTLIAFFLSHLAGGGAERVAVNLATSLLNRGYAVDMVLVRAEGPLLGEVPPGVRVVDLHRKRTLTSLPALVRYMRREKPCVLMSILDHTNLIAIWSKLLARTDTKVVIDNQIHLSTLIRHTPKIQEKIYPYLIRLFERNAAAVVSVSQGAADDLSHLAGIRRERITVIYNPVVYPEMDKLKDRPLDHPWFAPGQPPVVLGGGRLTLQKDFPTLLRAFSLVRQERPARLVILGEGELRQELSALALELHIDADFDLPGFVNPYAYMARSGVFVLSSAWEGFGNVLVEAMACGTQVVSTDCPSGPSEILEGGKFGRLTPVGDPDALARAIQDALDHPLPASFLRARAAIFSVEAAAEKYLQVIGCA